MQTEPNRNEGKHVFLCSVVVSVLAKHLLGVFGYSFVNSQTPKTEPNMFLLHSSIYNITSHLSSPIAHLPNSPSSSQIKIKSIPKSLILIFLLLQLHASTPTPLLVSLLLLSVPFTKRKEEFNF
ncbi:hypothetical protein FRX31_012367 [Thalictrum thalictroides]|uniref:Transmembrane protein n=1 Tax=Thalictrum thalictroides TaxID=46969 RepID=A0A7J6WNL0_THATH|nr:hypothetical protein FRX31_012367 [Thalictrum thalictroides]